MKAKSKNRQPVLNVNIPTLYMKYCTRIYLNRMIYTTHAITASNF